MKMTGLFAAKDFLPLETLAARKRAAGVRVSLVIPTLNEATTIGAIVATARRDLQEGHTILDEIIVMDGGSTDGTAAIASEAGAAVHHTAQVLPQHPYPAGKGTSLWKSLAVATGDILVYSDADIVNFGSHFVYGLVGALLHDTGYACVRSYYQRPLVVNDIAIENYGGRVTEILVRPLLSIWYPALAPIRQPLSGEYAYRRSALEQLSFTSGYGVEIRLLLETYRKFGLAGMAQVDMGRRHHRNRPVSQLGVMSHAVALEMTRILREEGRIRWEGILGETMITCTEAGCREIETHETTLPPFREICT